MDVLDVSNKHSLRTFIFLLFYGGAGRIIFLENTPLVQVNAISLLFGIHSGFTCDRGRARQDEAWFGLL